MSAVLAPHHGIKVVDYVADRYGNDPFVWTNPLLWSHCHARPRGSRFGLALREPLVCGKDCVFFLTYDQQIKVLLCDCVFVIAEILPIHKAERRYSTHHPIRHYHFDQDRNPDHKKSRLTRIADSRASFIPHPPAPIGDWIESHVETRKLRVDEYFALKKRKNVRVITRDAQGIYDRINAWSSQPGHQKLSCLPLLSLQQIQPKYPGAVIIDWALRA